MLCVSVPAFLLAVATCGGGGAYPYPSSLTQYGEELNWSIADILRKE